MPDLDDRPIWAGPLEAVMIADPRPQPCDLCLRIDLAEFVNGGGKPGHMPAPEWGSSARRFLTVGQG
jgi:hypothetical protein